jgi:hypothetical protein
LQLEQPQFFQQLQSQLHLTQQLHNLSTQAKSPQPLAGGFLV